MRYLLVVLLASSVQAASTGTLTLSGVVAPSFNLTVTPNGSNTNLDIINGQTVVVATVTELSNNATGYRILVSSLNAGKLKSGPTEIAYTASYAGNAYGNPPSPGSSSLLAAPRVNSTHTMKLTSGPSNLPAGTVSNVSVTVPASPNTNSGTYSDTVTFEIVAP